MPFSWSIKYIFHTKSYWNEQDKQDVKVQSSNRYFYNLFGSLCGRRTQLEYQSNINILLSYHASLFLLSLCFKLCEVNSTPCLLYFNILIISNHNVSVFLPLNTFISHPFTRTFLFFKNQLLKLGSNVRYSIIRMYAYSVIQGGGRWEKEDLIMLAVRLKGGNIELYSIMCTIMYTLTM